MSVKILEGDNLETLIERAKAIYGGDIEILYYQVETKSSLLPFTKKKLLQKRNFIGSFLKRKIKIVLKQKLLKRSLIA
ncbi:hypothetical protein [Desulfurobacterium sp.]